MANNLANLHRVMLIIAGEIDRICSKYSIPYSIDSGTLLGAVRHKGFIPWDDDFDIIMKRTDFERFIKICQSEIDYGKFFLQWEGSEPYYAFGFAKLQLKGTSIIEDFCLNVPLHNGIFVDIIPLDNLPDNQIKRTILKMRNHILKNLIWIKCGYGSVTHGDIWWYKIGKIISRPFSLEWLKKERHRIVTSYNDINTEKCFKSDFPKNDYLNSWFEKIRLYDFENTKFAGIDEYNKYLSMLYGDYMKLPPENERESHTEYEIAFGPYKD